MGIDQLSLYDKLVYQFKEQEFTFSKKFISDFIFWVGLSNFIDCHLNILVRHSFKFCKAT